MDGVMKHGRGVVEGEWGHINDVDTHEKQSC